jgi:hypothetical protein
MVPISSVDVERSVSQYTAVNGPQRQSFTDANLAMQVNMGVGKRVLGVLDPQSSLTEKNY